MLSSDDHEFETLRRAREGDHEAGREALRLCRAALDAGTLSRALQHYLAERLWQIERAIEEADQLRAAGKPSGSVRSARDAGIAEALCLNRKDGGRPADPFPAWKQPYAAFGTLLLKAGLAPERVKAAMDEVRQQVEGPGHGWDRRDACQLLQDYMPMRQIDDDILLHLAGPLGEKLPTFLPQQLKS